MQPEILKNNFTNRNELISYVRTISPQVMVDSVSKYIGGHRAASKAIGELNLEDYATSRNYFDGCNTQLSPYINHGLLSVDEIKEIVTNIKSNQSREKFLQQLAWREFWKHVANKHPQWLWNDVEPYKTGYKPDDYENKLHDDIASGNTGVKVIDYLSEELVNTGYIHNHARMYLASYIVHWRRTKWQAGAEWFLKHLIDADEASNNFSWQWIASTFSHKPYIFNLDNVRKFSNDPSICASHLNKELDYSYTELNKILFPRINTYE